MSNSHPKIRVAVVQAASVFLDRDATVAKAVRLIHEAGAGGAKVVAFPESFIPGHPLWYHFYLSGSRESQQFASRLFVNSVEIPGPVTEALGRAAKEVGVHVVMGVTEKVAGSFGTLFNTQLFLGPNGEILGKHQKLSPTGEERLVHTGGYGDTLRTIGTQYGNIAGLICGETRNPLSIFTLLMEYPMIWVLSWPNRFGKEGGSMPDRSLLAGRSVAMMSKAFVLNACGTMTNELREALNSPEVDRENLFDDSGSGGSCIIDPYGNIVAGPLGSDEAILYADIDLGDCVAAKIEQDLAGHYNRPDVFHLLVNSSAPNLLTRHETEKYEGQVGDYRHTERMAVEPDYNDEQL